MAAEPIWNSELIERNMLNNAEVSALRHLDFLRGADLWCEESQTPWTAEEMYDHFANNFSLRARLGMRDNFIHKWNDFIRRIPKKVWTMLKNQSSPIEEGSQFAYIKTIKLNTPDLSM